MVLSLLKTWSVREMLVASCPHQLRETCQEKLNISHDSAFCVVRQKVILWDRRINKLHFSKTGVVLSLLCHTGQVIVSTFSTLTRALWGKKGFLHEERIQEAASRASPQTCLASLSSSHPWQIYWELKPCMLKESLLIPPQCTFLSLKVTRLFLKWLGEKLILVYSAELSRIYCFPWGKKKTNLCDFWSGFFMFWIVCFFVCLFIFHIVSLGHSWACVV